MRRRAVEVQPPGGAKLVNVHWESPGETLWAVVTGAVLATTGGLVATQLESFVRRRERERSAALFFGEILTALETITTIAGESQHRGEPYGPITMRLLRAALRETETYAQNRAMLYDIRDAEIRIRTHVVMVQVSLALEGVSDASAHLASEQSNLSLETSARQAQTQQLIEILTAQREQAFTFVLTVAKNIKPIVAALQPIAKVDFENLKRLSGNPFDNGPSSEPT